MGRLGDGSRGKLTVKVLGRPNTTSTRKTTYINKTYCVLYSTQTLGKEDIFFPEKPILVFRQQLEEIEKSSSYSTSTT